MLNAALEGKPNGNAGRGAYRESGTEAVRNPKHPNFNPKNPVKYNGNRNNQWINNHSFYAENEDDAFIMRKNRFIQFNTITYRNNYVWTTKPNIRKHNPKSAFANDVYYLIKSVGKPLVPKKGAPAPSIGCNWKEHGGRGRALDIGSNGSHLYVIGTNSILYKSNGNGWSAIDKTSKKLRRIDVHANGDVWAIGTDSKVWHFKFNERRWIDRGGKGIDIGVGKGVVYILDLNGRVRKFVAQGRYAAPLPGGGKRIDVDGGGNPSVVGGNNKLYRWTGKNWWHPQQSSKLRLQDIGMSPSSNAVALSTTDNKVYASVNSGAYKQIASGQATQVTMSSGGVLWLINPQRKIYSKGCINSGAKILNTIANTLDIEVYPNPVSTGESINVKMPSGESATITTSLSDLSGKVVYTNTITNAEGDQQLSVNTTGLSKGLYLLRVSTGSRTKIEKIIIE